MRVRLLVALNLFVALVLLAQPLVGRTAEAQAGTKKQVSYRGISFTFDASLASSVLPMSVAEQVKGWAEVPDWQQHPEHVKFEFVGFPSPVQWDSAIYIFPVQRIQERAGPNDVWLMRVTDLRSVLSQRPVWQKPTWRVGGNLGPQPIPFLPPINAATIYVGQQRYMKFQVGEGVRYLTQVTQQPQPIGREETLYTFQGLTNDGRHYIAARFPTFLIKPLPTPTPVGDNWVDDYNQQAMQSLEQAKNDEYQPNLDKLDEMIQSIRVDSSATGLSASPSLPGLPRTGAPSVARNYLLESLAALVGVLLALGALALRRTRLTK